MSETIELDFTDDELLRFALLAHEEGITLNQWLTNVVIRKVTSMQDDLIKSLQDEVVELKEHLQETFACCGECEQVEIVTTPEPQQQDMMGFPI